MDNIKFGNFIAQRRKALGLTQKDLASKLHVTDKAVSKWETGKGLPDLKIMEPLAEALEVTLYELMEGQTAPVSPQNPYIQLHEADRVVRQTAGYSRERKKKTPGQKLGRLLLILLILYLGCFTYDNFVPGRHFYSAEPAIVYDTDGTAAGKVKVNLHGKLKNSLLPFYMDDFVGTVSMKLPEMETGELVHVWLVWQNDTPQTKTGHWLIVTAGGMANDLLSTLEKEVVFEKDLKEFAFAFADGRIVATSKEMYDKLIEELSVE